MVREGRIKVTTDLTKFAYSIRQKSAPEDVEANLEMLKSQYEDILKGRFEQFPAGVFSIDIDTPVQIASDIYVHPAKTEAIGLAIQEAHAARNYIIASKTGGIPQALDPSQDTLAHRVEDADGLRRIEKWEESISEFAKRNAGVQGSITLNGRRIDLSTVGELELLTILSESSAAGSIFELDGTRYDLGKNILIAEKEIEDLRSGRAIEAEFYISKIRDYQTKLSKKQDKQVTNLDTNLLALSREIILEKLREKPRISTPIPTIINPATITALRAEMEKIHPRDELFALTGFNKQEAGKIMNLFKKEEPITIEDLKTIRHNADADRIVEIMNRKIEERRVKQAEIDLEISRLNELLTPGQEPSAAEEFNEYEASNPLEETMPQESVSI
ncbi:MAG TPA: glycosyltransferase [Candidatus Nanoarchaeia archaeon]|nr:glycosyltransferase [Candidatus Nanoarchaeia archaeon]